MSCLNILCFPTLFITFYLISCFFVANLVAEQTILEGVRSHPNWKILNRGENCGLSASDRIIGGNKASIGQYPWIARIGYSALREGKYGSEMVYPCGGTIISERYVLTAAHCSPYCMLVQVRVGEQSTLTNPDCMHGVCAPPVQDVLIEEYYVHTGYKSGEQRDDICIVRLFTSIIFNKYVSPICLPVYKVLESNTFKDTIMEVAGWGITNLAIKKLNEDLMTLALPLVSHSECQHHFYNYSLTNKQLCAGGVVGQDSCTGDSGGPLMTSLSVDGPPRYFLIGIVSYGDSDCGKTKSPAVYTKVTEYLTWILDHVRE